MTDRQLKIYDFLRSKPNNIKNWVKAPENIGVPSSFDVDLEQNLRVKETYSNGDLTRIEYYRDYDSTTKTFIDQIVDISFSTLREIYYLPSDTTQSNPFTYTPVETDIIQSYVRKDASLLSLTPKIVNYDTVEDIEENLRQRRQNVIDYQLFPQAELFGVDNIARALFSELQSEVIDYVNGGSSNLYNATIIATTPGLDTIVATTTPRLFVLSLVQIGIPLEERLKLNPIPPELIP